METDFNFDPKDTAKRADYNIVVKHLEGSMAVLVLGILSLMLCWFYGVISIILGIVALVMAGNAQREYQKHPGLFTEVSYRNMRTGRLCAILGLSFGIVSLLIVLLWAILFGTMLFAFIF